MSKGTINYKPDSKGQLELEGIDTPLGEKADRYIETATKARRAIEARNEAELELVAEMKATGIRTLKYKGDKLRYQPGHSTPEKIKFMPSE